jgi:hypothetical protein
MTVVEILIGAYLIVGLLAAALIWIALIASKRRADKTKDVNHDYLKYSPFRERNTKPSRFHT